MTDLNFKGKEFVYNHHLAVPFRPLVPDATKGIGPVALDGNLIIHGDNLHALKALLPLYAGKVDCVYIDPPYNTGNEGWCYNDNVNSPVIKEWINSNPVGIEDGLRHDKWCAMMWPRLRLLRELLADNGVIFVSIDDNEQHHLRMLMDEVFGDINFFAVLTRRAMHTVRNSSKDFNLNADYVLAYAKDKTWFSSEKARYIRHITDKASKYPHDDNDGRGQYKLDPIHARNYYEPYTFTFANGTIWQPPSGKYPRYSKCKLREMEQQNRIVFSGREPKAKRYLNEVQEGQPPDAILSPEEVGFNKDGTRELQELFGTGGVFPQPKPTKLVKFLLAILRRKDAIVLDSFAGSGTTAHAVLALNKEDGGNRKFILVECEKYADTTTAERVRHAIKGVPSAHDQSLREGLGGTFTYYTLGSPVELDKILSGETLPSYSGIGASLFHMATNSALTPATVREADFYLGATAGQHVWLIYKPDLDYLKSPDSALTLTRAKKFAETAPDKRHLVFASTRFVSQKMLAEQNIPVEFVPLPYALYRIDPS